MIILCYSRDADTTFWMHAFVSRCLLHWPLGDQFAQVVRIWKTSSTKLESNFSWERKRWLIRCYFQTGQVVFSKFLVFFDGIWMDGIDRKNLVLPLLLYCFPVCAGWPGGAIDWYSKPDGSSYPNRFKCSAAFRQQICADGNVENLDTCGGFRMMLHEKREPLRKLQW